MDGGTKKKIYGDSEDVKEKQEELKDNVKERVRGVGRSVERVLCEPCF